MGKLSQAELSVTVMMVQSKDGRLLTTGSKGDFTTSGRPVTAHGAWSFSTKELAEAFTDNNALEEPFPFFKDISAYRNIPKSATDRVLELGIARSKLVNSLCFPPPRKRVKDRADHVASHIIQGGESTIQVQSLVRFVASVTEIAMLPTRRISMWYAMMAERRMLTRR